MCVCHFATPAGPPKLRDTFANVPGRRKQPIGGRREVICQIKPAKILQETCCAENLRCYISRPLFKTSSGTG